MNCSACAHDNPADARFCEECGADLARACAACGTANGPTAKFCKNCRASLTGEAPAQATPEPPPVLKTPPLPTSFGAGRYTVKAFLGEGAKKRVYLAHDTRLDRDVAFALIKTEGLDGDGVVRIRREAQAMGRLGDHPHIVTVFDAGEENGAPFIVAQHMSSGSVEDLLAKTENHRVSPEQAMRIGVQVAEALAHAHGRGIIHRDLKPGNVWLDGEGNAALGDFGLAVAIDRSRMTMQGMMVGTVAYMSPEQALGRAPDARSDLYSLGAMIYEMVAGRPPFLGDDAVGVISQHINTAPVAPSWHEPMVPSPLESLILRLLAKSPDERPATAQDVANELRQILARSTITAHPHGVADEITDLRELDWGRFVGRRDEMAQLKAALEHALSGKTALAFIAGEPGIGKTRLAEEFAVYAELRGAKVLTGRSYEGESTVPYRPFIEALRQYVRAQPDGDLRQQLGTGAPEIASMVSDVRQRFPDIQEAPRLDGDAERFRLFDSITTFLRNASVAQPVVLLLDDLHWVDRPSLLLLQHIARHATNDRLLLMATYRDVELERTHPLSEALAGFRRMERFTRIPLRGLVQDEVYELLTSIESDEETAEGRNVLATAIWRETEGNPFFIKEVLQHLVETGKLVHEHGRWTAGGLTVDDLGIPEGVREVIGRRLSRLSDTANTALTRASAMTRGFTWEQFRAINASTDEGELLDVLDEALRTQLLQERKGETPVVYDFTHALIRQTLYEELSTPRRVLLHREIAQSLEQLYGDNTDPHLGELAYHYFHAAAGGDAQKAIEYCTRAGDRAAALYGHEDAIAHYERALQIMDMQGATSAEARRAETLAKLGNSQWRSGHPREALDTYRLMASLTRGAETTEQLAEAAIGFAEASFLVSGELGLRGEAEQLLLEALDGLGDAETPARVRLLGLRTRVARPRADIGIFDEISSGGYSAYVGGRDPEQVEDARRALEIAHKLGDDDLIAFSLHCLRGCLWRADNPDERIEVSRAMAEHANRAGNFSLEVLAMAWLVIDALDRGDLEEHDRARRREEQIAAVTRQPFERWLASVAATAAPLIRGRWEEAERLTMAAMALGQEGNVAEAAAAFGAQLNGLRCWQGRAAEVVPIMRQAVASSPSHWAYNSTLASDLALAGERDESRAILEELSSRDFSTIPNDYLRCISIYCLSLACFYADAPKPARELYDLVQRHEDLQATVAGVSINGPMTQAMLMLSVTLDLWEDAERYYSLACQRLRTLDAEPPVAEMNRIYADMLLRRDEPGDREKALVVIETALDAGQRLGMAKVVQDCLALKVKAQGIDPSSMSLYMSIDRVANAAQEERPAVWRDAVAPDGTVTIMFSDIEDSTVLTEKLGDQRWQELLRAHDALVRQNVEAYGGFVVKHLGDGFMMAFQSSRKALDCAIAIQQTFAKEGALPEPVRVRIGLHAGEALRENDDFFGKNVVMASRVAGQAKGGEILVSSVLRSLVESSVNATLFDGARNVTLKGLEGAHTVHPIRWQAAING